MGQDKLIISLNIQMQDCSHILIEIIDCDNSENEKEDTCYCSPCVEVAKTQSLPGTSPVGSH